MCVCVCVCVCAFLTTGILFFSLFCQKSNLQRVQITVCLPNATAIVTLKIIWHFRARSSWPLCLKPRAYRVFFCVCVCVCVCVHFQTTNTAGTKCRFMDFLLSLVPNLSMTHIKLFGDWGSVRKYLGHFRWGDVLAFAQESSEGWNPLKHDC